MSLPTESYPREFKINLRLHRSHSSLISQLCKVIFVKDVTLKKSFPGLLLYGLFLLWDISLMKQFKLSLRSLTVYKLYTERQEIQKRQQRKLYESYINNNKFILVFSELWITAFPHIFHSDLFSSTETELHWGLYRTKKQDIASIKRNKARINKCKSTAFEESSTYLLYSPKSFMIPF